MNRGGNSASSGAGTQTAALAAGGLAPDIKVGSTEEYNGSAWITSASMTTARDNLGASTAGTTSSSMVFAGRIAPNAKQVITEEFTGETTALNLKTLTDS